MELANLHIERFRITGSVMPLRSLMKATMADAKGYSRPMGGWLMTYGKIGENGGVVPTEDREGHTADVASQLGLINWTKYLKGGVWNDTHNEGVVVGLPIPGGLEFHDGTTELSNAHGKVGFWTAGRLFDKADPSSWLGLTDKLGKARRPTTHEFERADRYWALAHMLKGLPRSLMLSAHGLMALSPCGRRIIYAEVSAAAVCDLGINPDCTLDMMKAIAKIQGGDVTPMQLLAKGRRFPRVGLPSCGNCTCPAGACERITLAKGFPIDRGSEPFPGPAPSPSNASMSRHRPLVPEDLEAVARGKRPRDERWHKVVALIVKKFQVDPKQAEKWLIGLITRRHGERNAA